MATWLKGGQAPSGTIYMVVLFYDVNLVIYEAVFAFSAFSKSLVAPPLRVKDCTDYTGYATETSPAYKAYARQLLKNGSDINVAVLSPAGTPIPFTTTVSSSIDSDVAVVIPCPEGLALHAHTVIDNRVLTIEEDGTVRDSDEEGEACAPGARSLFKERSEEQCYSQSLERLRLLLSSERPDSSASPTSRRSSKKVEPSSDEPKGS